MAKMIQKMGHLDYLGDLCIMLQVQISSVRFRLHITALLALALVLPYASSTVYTVGDTSLWNTGVNYSAWVSGKTFAVGDDLTFIYASNHDVLEVSKSAYDSCNTASPIKTESDSPTIVTLDKTGRWWFICGTPNDCSGGMKLAVNVSAASPASPPPPGANTNSLPPPSADTPSSARPGSTTTSPPPSVTNTTSHPPPGATTTSGPRLWEIFRGMVILISSVASFIVICIFIFVGRRWYLKSKSRGDIEESDEELNRSLRQAAQSVRSFPYVDLSAATKNFSDTEKIGGGGFGIVYRGTLPGTNEAVAIKRVSPTSTQGKQEYESEVIINSRLTHHNLVKFLGWCHRKDDLLLVYELLSNGSLDKYLFGKVEGALNWDQRYSIACDVASALVYLHEDRHESVVHRDIKASNVMLDSNFKAKLGDFGLARVVQREKGGHTTLVAGTIGYIAPESVTTGKATRESDVFSFGALALEIACGRRPADWSLIEHNNRVVEWVWHLHGQHRILDAADEKLGGNFNDDEMERLMKVGLLCSHPDPNARLRMEKVVGILKRGAELPHVPLEFPIPVYDHRPLLDIISSSISIVDGIVYSLSMSSTSSGSSSLLLHSNAIY